MDRQSTIGFVFIALVLMAWMWYSAPNPNKQELKAKSELAKDTAHPKAAAPLPQKVTTDKQAAGQTTQRDTLGNFFAGAAIGTERFLTIETDQYKATLSSKGGVIRTWEMKQYNTWSGQPVQLVGMPEQGDFSLLFNTTDGKLINTRSLYFDVPFRTSQTVKLSGTDEYTVAFELKAGSGRIIKTLRFKNGEYTFGATVTLKGMQSVIANYEYQVIWESGLRYAEANSVDESQSAKAFVYAGGEVSEIDATKIGETPESNTKVRQTGWRPARNISPWHFSPMTKRLKGDILADVTRAHPMAARWNITPSV